MDTLVHIIWFDSYEDGDVQIVQKLILRKRIDLVVFNAYSPVNLNYESGFRVLDLSQIKIEQQSLAESC